MKIFNQIINHRIIPFIMMFILPIGIMAQDNDKSYIRTTKKNTTYKLVGWETNVNYNPYTYTWYYWEEPEMKKVTNKVTQMVPISEFDRPPVFSEACMKKEDMFECSNTKMQEYFANQNLDYPDMARTFNQEGLEYVTFTLKSDGTFADDMRVLSKNEDPCMGCADAAADIVANMERKWHPAILDGQPVKTQMTIPVRFKLIN